MACAQETIEKIEAPGIVDKQFEEQIKQFHGKIKNALNDDFNTAEFISYIFEVVRQFNAFGIHLKAKRNSNQKGQAQSFLNFMQKYGSISALFNEDPLTFLDELNGVVIKIKKIDERKVEELIQRRQQARESKDWNLADKIRDELNVLGIELLDGHNKGWKVNVTN
jgi:cysteinyl-tRNA synthetase